VKRISPQQKEGSSKKRGQGLKRKSGKTSLEKLHVLRREKKKRMRSTSCWERFY
jgi:hypothetical protein